MNDFGVKQWVAVVAAVLMSCGGEPEGNTGGGNGATGGGSGGGGGGSASAVKASDCTLSATIEEFGTAGTRAGRAGGSLSCPASATLEISVCIQSSMTMSFTDGPCASGMGTNTVIARSAEASFAGTRNVRSFVRGRVNGVDLPDMPSAVISIVR